MDRFEKTFMKDLELTDTETLINMYTEPSFYTDDEHSMIKNELMKRNIDDATIKKLAKRVSNKPHFDNDEPISIKCPYCKTSVVISSSDIEWGDVKCNKCGKYIDIDKEQYNLDEIKKKEYSQKTKPKEINSKSSNSKSISNIEKADTKKEKVNNINSSLSAKELDIVMSIASIKRIGIIAMFCAFFNPVITLFLASFGKGRGKQLKEVPSELNVSLNEAIWYNQRGITISVLLIVLDVLAAIIGFMVYMSA